MFNKREYDKQYDLDHKEHLTAIRNEWRRKNIVKVRAQANARQRKKAAEKRAARVPLTEKICPKCEVVKPINQFKGEKKCAHCKQCRLEYKRSWKRANKEKLNVVRREYLARNKEKINAYNAEKKVLRRKMAVPVWADRQKIAGFYKDAVERSKLTGIRYEVDHIIPLTNKIVCGLHVETNLRVITRSENARKRNLFVGF